MARPLKFKSNKELQSKIAEYFKNCETKKIPVTISGLALFLNTTRETLMDYQEKDGFSDTIKKAKLMIENAYEIRLCLRGNSGDIFALKNFGWTDKSSSEFSGSVSFVKMESITVEGKPLDFNVGENPDNVKTSETA